MYKVRIDKFEGPFDLLVYLIQNAKMDIYDIDVYKRQVHTRQYRFTVDMATSRNTELRDFTEMLV